MYGNPFGRGKFQLEKRSDRHNNNNNTYNKMEFLLGIIDQFVKKINVKEI